MKGPRGNNDESSWVLLRRALLAAVVLALGVPVVAHAHNRTKLHCTGEELRAVPEGIAGVSGYYATPAGRPVGLVVFFHGYGHTAKDWADNHLERVAQRNQVIALAMDYPVPAGVENPQEYTWQVREGAEASNEVATEFVDQCRGLDTVVAYGVSMGGNASGLALAKAPGLYDWWFDIEGANNVIETYNEARAVATANGDPFAKAAARGIELEMGDKTFEEAPQTYLEHANVFLADKIAASGIDGVVMVHAPDDGLVPYNQSREMQAALLTHQVPVQFWTVGTCESGCERDTTIDGYADHGQGKPLAGHSNESDYWSLVGNTGFDRLDKLFAGITPATSGEFVRDDRTDTYTKPEA